MYIYLCVLIMQYSDTYIAALVQYNANLFYRVSDACLRMCS